MNKARATKFKFVSIQERFDSIGPGDRVLYQNRFGQRRWGRAVMRGPHGWVLNMGGPHGTPQVVSNPLDVWGVRKAKKPGPRI